MSKHAGYLLNKHSFSTRTKQNPLLQRLKMQILKVHQSSFGKQLQLSGRLGLLDLWPRMSFHNQTKYIQID